MTILSDSALELIRRDVAEQNRSANGIIIKPFVKTFSHVSFDMFNVLFKKRAGVFY